MSTFTAKAFVRIKDDLKRNEIVKILEEIGYKCLYGGSVGDNVIVIKDGMMAIDYAMPCDCINCLEYANNDEELAIILFLELANIRSDTDKDQWFITEADQAWVNQGIYSPKGSFEKCLVEDRNMGLGDNARFLNSICPVHKATPQQLADAVKNNMNIIKHIYEN